MAVPKPATVEELAKRGVRVKPLGWCADTLNGRNGEWVRNEAIAIEADHIAAVLKLIEIVPVEELADVGR